MPPKLNKKSLLFTKPLRDKKNLKIEEGMYFSTRDGWIARIIYVDKDKSQCCAVHNPGTPYEVGPVFHDAKTGFAMPYFGILEPPAFTGHPADLIEEVSVN